MRLYHMTMKSEPVMTIKGPSGAVMNLFEPVEESLHQRTERLDIQCEAIRKFMEVEAEWQRLKV